MHLHHLLTPGKVCRYCCQKDSREMWGSQCRLPQVTNQIHMEGKYSSLTPCVLSHIKETSRSSYKCMYVCMFHRELKLLFQSLFLGIQNYRSQCNGLEQVAKTKLEVRESHVHYPF